MVIPYHRPDKIEVDFSDIFESGMLTNGKYCRELEDKIGRMYKCHCLTCSSGTSGIMLLLGTLYDNKRIVTMPSFTWYSVEYIVRMMGKEIIFRDIDENTWLVNGLATTIRQHTFGNVDTHSFPCIYDGTHALGSELRDLGFGTVISLAPTKMVTAGEGGLILTDGYNQELELYRDKCSRMSEFHAKIGLEYLKKLDIYLANKKRIYEYYKANINGIFQEIPYDSNYNTIGFLNVNNLLIDKEIETRKYYYPLDMKRKNSAYVFDNIECLPSWYGVDYKKVVELIE